ncbi:hypothetical protein SSX86_017232 [Deinandra increscens subsp. villosa]|uniref:Protein kinase domain-containing protein n=1 Tax=Deinandra increscens subsp. villosa TaxID=3103831 RepID=A0AAP0D006_9ASTR
MEPQLSEVEQVLQFFRKNGLQHSESALIDDIIDKSHLASFDFQTFIFPTSLPPLKIPTLNDDEAAVSPSSSSSDDDEFLTVNSFTSDSEFTNPYGIRTTRRNSSHASSDRLSQFGTARDYHDFDLQNDVNWYTERDEDYAMPPLFDNSDPFSGPTEDKFVMSSDKENQDENRQPFLDPMLDPFGQTNDLDKPWPLTLTPFGYVKDGVEGINLNDFQEIDTGHKTDVCKSCLEENKISCDCYLVEGSKSAHELKNHLGGKGEDFDFNSNSEGIDERNLQEHDESDPAKVKEGDPDATNLNYANEDEYEVFDLRIIHRKNRFVTTLKMHIRHRWQNRRVRTGFEENKDLPIVLNGMIGSRYCVTEYLGSAAFSKVVQAHDLQTGIDVCLKIIKNDKDFFDQSLDEIKLLKFVNKYDPADEHHILRLYDYFYFQEHLIIVCELLCSNLYEYQKYNKECGREPYFTLNRLQVITRQCLEALEYLHELGIIHCDLKPENILIKSYSRCEIKVIDLGSSCFQNDNLSLYVQSRSYRAPEVIIGLPYDQKIDLWSLGCILAELYSGDVLFPNDELVILLARVIGMLGPIDIEMLENGQETDKYFTKDFDLYRINEETEQLEYIIPQKTSLEEQLQVSDALFLDFVRNLLEINPQNRPTASEALQHPWLSSSVGHQKV